MTYETSKQLLSDAMRTFPLKSWQVKQKKSTIQKCGLGSSKLNKLDMDNILAALADTDFPIQKKTLLLKIKELNIPHQRSIKKMAYACLWKMADPKHGLPKPQDPESKHVPIVGPTREKLAQEARIKLDLRVHSIAPYAYATQEELTALWDIRREVTTLAMTLVIYNIY